MKTASQVTAEQAAKALKIDALRMLLEEALEYAVECELDGNRDGLLEALADAKSCREQLEELGVYA